MTSKIMTSTQTYSFKTKRYPWKINNTFISTYLGCNFDNGNGSNNCFSFASFSHTGQNCTNGIDAVHKIKLVSWGRVLQTNTSSDQNLKGRYINRSRPLGRETSGKWPYCLMEGLFFEKTVAVHIISSDQSQMLVDWY